MFNFRNCSKSNSKKETKQYNLDIRHNEFMKKFEETKKSLPELKKKFVALANEYSIYKKKNKIDMTNNDIDRKFKLKKELKELRKRINSIENNEDVIKYYMKVGSVLHDYYEDKYNHKDESENDKHNEFIITKKVTKNEEDHPIRKKKFVQDNVIDYFNNRERTSTNTNESTNYKNVKMSNFIETKSGFQRANLLDDYLKKVDKSYNPKININSDCNKCSVCDMEMVLYPSQGFQICEKCGKQENIIIESDKPSFKDPPPEVAYFAYKRMNHFNECLAQFQGKESTEVPDEVFNKLILEIKKERIRNLANLNYNKIKQYLKKLKLNKYYEHIPHILNRINGLPPPVLSKQLEEKLRLMFKEIQSPFREECPKERKNFLSYSYVLYKFIELLGIDEYKQYFALLKDRDKLYETDKIWKGICKRLNWEFIRSI